MQSSIKACQTLLRRARRETPKQKIAPTSPRAAASTAPAAQEVAAVGAGTALAKGHVLHGVFTIRLLR